MQITFDQFNDGLTNLFSALGTSRDPRTHSHYYVPVLTQPQIEAAYRTSWLTRKIHDLIPFEMTRAGRNWQATKEQIPLLEGVEKKLQLWKKLREALSTARLHGGAAIVLGVRQGMPDQPLRTESLVKGSLQYAVVFSRHQIHAPEGMETDPLSPYFMQPKMYEIRAPRGNPIKVHPSRVLPFHGAPLPAGAATVSEIDRFWGDPLLLSVQDAIQNADTTQAAVAALLHEMKQDVVSIPGFTRQLATEKGEELLAARLRAHSQFKSLFNAIILDGGDPKTGDGAEKWETRQLSFAQHPEILRQFLAVVAGAADIPVTRLMGESPGGLNSTGKGEQEDFNRMIAARQDAELTPALLRLDEILIPSALGRADDKVYSEMAPLDELSAQVLSEIEKREAETVEVYARTAQLPADALAAAVRNRMIESGRWPGLADALEEAEKQAKEEPGEGEDDLPPAGNDNDVQEMERTGTITRDQALSLLADASPRTLYVKRDVLNAGEILAWAKEQGFTTTESADELHVTVLYSRDRVDWLKAETDWNQDDDGKMVIAAGGARMVEPLGEKGAVVLLFNSSHLVWRHESISRNTGARHTFPEYQPHVTITYDAPADLDLATVEPYRGVIELGPEYFEEVDDVPRVPHGR